MIKDKFAKIRKGGGLVAALVLLAILVLPLPTVAFVPDAVLSIPDAEAEYCHNVTVALDLDDVVNFATGEIHLLYDGSVVEVMDVLGGDIDPFSYSIDNVAGETIMTWLEIGGVSGDKTLANIILHAVGSAGDTSPLGLDVTTCANTSGDPIPHTVVNGTFTVTGVPDISVNPTTKNFGDVQEDTSSAAQTFTVSNDGTGALVIGTVALGGANPSQFDIQNDNASGQTIDPAGSRTVDVVFSPTSTGTKTANLVIPSNDTAEDPLTVPLQGRGTAAPVPAPVAIQVAFLLDTSGSIGSGNWGIIVNGLADAVENADCFPHNGSVELTVVRFSGSADVPVGPVVLTAANAANVSAMIRAIGYLGGGTCISCAFDAAADALKNSPNYSRSLKQAINLVTDGYPNSKTASEEARDDCIDLLDMSETQDVICSEGIGSGPDMDWLRTEIAFPQPGCEWPVGEPSPVCSGWVRQVADAEAFADTVCEKIKAIVIPPPQCAFTAQPSVGMAPLKVRFIDKSTGDIDTWNWDFDDDGVNSTLQNPTHTYMDAGIYTVTLTVTGPGGSSQCDTEIRVREFAAEVEEGPNLAAAYLLITPDVVVPDQEVEISINIGNDGGTVGTRSIALYINGELEQSQTVSVSPGSAKNIIFRVSKSEPGIYHVMLEGNEGQFTVQAPAKAKHWSGPLGTPGIIVIVVVAVVLIVAIVFVFVRRE